MRECFEKKSSGDTSVFVSLNFQERSKSRGKAKASDDQEVAWFLERGHVMADGEVLVSQDGDEIKVIAAPEAVSEVHATGAALVEAAYHLGNRHLAIEVGEGWLRYQQDHVIDDMVHSLGIKAKHLDAPFHPLSGAYSSHSHGGHSHSHSHSHGHGHSHDHD
jgi:urease accessory protein